MRRAVVVALVALVLGVGALALLSVSAGTAGTVPSSTAFHSDFTIGNVSPSQYPPCSSTGTCGNSGSSAPPLWVFFAVGAAVVGTPAYVVVRIIKNAKPRTPVGPPPGAN